MANIVIKSKNAASLLHNLIIVRTCATQNKKLRRVVVTGVGAVSPLGRNVPESWQRIIEGKSAVSRLDEKFKGLPCQVAAQICRENLSLDPLLSKTDKKLMTSATQFSILAAEEAVKDAKLNLDKLNEVQRNRIGVCVGTGMFDLNEVYNASKQLEQGYNRLGPLFIVRLLPNMACGHISIRFSLRGPNHTVSTACATGAHAIGDAMRLIRNNDADVMLAGSGESCIDPLSIAGFCRLRALSTAHNSTPECASRPFDKSRDGFVMGEGAGILVLEALEYAQQRGAPILAEVFGYGLSGDAHHITSPSEDGTGAMLAMQRALFDAQVSPNQVTYVNTHATSTPIGDLVETRAIERVFGEHAPNVKISSTKGAHGHLLGAAGSLETVFVVKACQENLLPPSINIETLDDRIRLPVVTEAKEWVNNATPIKIALKNSFGFGGTNASLCIGEFRQ